MEQCNAFLARAAETFSAKAGTGPADDDDDDDDDDDNLHVILNCLE